MMRITYAHDFLEAAVLETERGAPVETRRAFRHERNRVYEIADPDARETAFRELHLDWFEKLRLHTHIEKLIGEKPELMARVRQCRVLHACQPQDEGADLFDYVGARGLDRQPLLVVRVRPSRFVDRPSLAAFLRHELMHIADMLDPWFGYRRALPPSEEGPSAATLLRDRYRTLWDVTIDGRLSRQGLSSPDVRTRRACEFGATFRMLGDQTARFFDEWFDRIDPTHDQLVEFALHLPRPRGGGQAGRCPLCRFPVAVLYAGAERMSAETRRQIEREHPDWHVDDGLCEQCLDLYEASHVRR